MSIIKLSYFWRDVGTGEEAHDSPTCRISVIVEIRTTCRDGHGDNRITDSGVRCLNPPTYKCVRSVCQIEPDLCQFSSRLMSQWFQRLLQSIKGVVSSTNGFSNRDFYLCCISAFYDVNIAIRHYWETFAFWCPWQVLFYSFHNLL